MASLNNPYTRLGMHRRYESWFLRFGLADGSGAWWLRYLLANPGRKGCPGVPRAAPVQIWATWFPRGGSPESFIQEFPIEALRVSARGDPFFLEAGPNRIEDSACRGALKIRGHKLSWDLRYRANFGITLSNKGWIGFSRTPHSDAVFSGEIHFDDQVFRGDPLGFGVQGHNCGFRHRNFWTWTHACFPQPDGRLSTFEALVYEMPLGLVFRKAILWHEGRSYVSGKLRESCRDPKAMRWVFRADFPAASIDVEIEGGGQSVHRLPYAKTDCTGTFEVANNSLALARLTLRAGNPPRAEEFATDGGAVLEMTGNY
ncbi:MAG: hypothetical protein ABSA32_01465 [Candidatus Acidiferrales bacterium]|jgi:hypothetical protein